ncbi:hypothetical protein [Paenibacillus alvei]|uniref:hypothetical protein n=1 Tax=Paenibacillus alvei TaxID=44250 RepID=UPI0013DBE875|nr:hypothetical protein [Paenibacillus alvei]NEZ41960.1 hypothetical protein [Paenibacillus alvei]
MKMKISSLAEIIAKSSFLMDNSYTSEELLENVNYILEYVDVIGEDNLPLRNPLNLDENVYYFRKRDVPLSGEEMVAGDYLLFDYVGHNEDMFLTQFKSLHELEAEMTNSGGITNPFTTYQIAIIHGVVKRYDIYFTNKLDGKEYKFIKDLHDALPEYRSLFSESNEPETREYEITNVRIVWRDS